MFFLAIVDEINYVNCLQGSFAFLDWFQSVLCIPYEEKWRWEMGTVIHVSMLSLKLQEAFAPGSSADNCKHLSLCLCMHVYESCISLLGHACSEVCDFVDFWMYTRCQSVWWFIYGGLFASICCVSMYVPVWARYMYKYAHAHTFPDCLFPLCLSLSLCPSLLHARSPVKNPAEC